MPPPPPPLANWQGHSLNVVLLFFKNNLKMFCQVLQHLHFREKDISHSNIIFPLFELLNYGQLIFIGNISI